MNSSFTFCLELNDHLPIKFHTFYNLSFEYLGRSASYEGIGIPIKLPISISSTEVYSGIALPCI